MKSTLEAAASSPRLPSRNLWNVIFRLQICAFGQSGSLYWRLYLVWSPFNFLRKPIAAVVLAAWLGKRSRELSQSSGRSRLPRFQLHVSRKLSQWWNVQGGSLCPLFSHALMLREGTLRPERGQALGQLSQDTAGRCCVGIPASVSRSIPTSSPLHVSLLHCSKYFPLRSKPSGWNCRVQIFWYFVLLWLIFVIEICMECKKPGRFSMFTRCWVRGIGFRAWAHLGETINPAVGDCGAGAGPNCFPFLTSGFLLAVLWWHLPHQSWGVNERSWETLASLSAHYMLVPSFLFPLFLRYIMPPNYVHFWDP